MKSTDSRERVSSWAIFLWLMPQVILLRWVLTANPWMFLAGVGLLFVVAFHVGKSASGIVVFPLAFVLTSIFTLVIEVLLGPEKVSPSLVGGSFVAALFASLILCSRVRFPTQRILDCEVPALFTSLVLVARWPQRSPVEFLGLLKFEDNAAWVGMASQYVAPTVEPHSFGFAAVGLRPVIGLVTFLQSEFVNELRISESYVLVGKTYQLLIFLAAAFAGCMIARLVPDARRHVRAMLSSAGCALAYVFLGLPLSTGHLTFIGALLFLWALISLPQERSNATSASFRLRLLLLMGAVGMWWPVGPLLPLIALPHFTRPLLQRMSNRRKMRAIGILPYIGLFLIFLAAIGGTIAVIRAMPMNPREFFTVKGGVQPLPQFLLPLGLLGWVALFQWRNLGAKIETWFTDLSILIGYSLLLVMTAQFVGPDYAINYSPAKLLLLVAILLCPLMLALPAYVLRQNESSMSTVAIALMIVSQGWFIGSWSVNNPRMVDPPSWARSMLRIVDTGETTVLCQTAVAEQRLSAYECSRHASALTNLRYEASADWGQMILYPGPQSVEREHRVKSIQETLSMQGGSGRRVILLSIDSSINIAEEDLWWMADLPWTSTRRIRP
jgi:hypothetical protein